MDSRIEALAECIVERSTAVIDLHVERNGASIFEPIHLIHYRAIRQQARAILEEISLYRKANPDLYKEQP